MIIFKFHIIFIHILYHLCLYLRFMVRLQTLHAHDLRYLRLASPFRFVVGPAEVPWQRTLLQVEPSSRRASTFFYESPRNLRIPIGFQGFQLHLQFDILRFYNQLHFCSRILILLCSFALSTPKRIRSKAIAPCKRTSTWPFLRTTSVPQRLRQFSRATWIVSVYSFLTCHNLHIPFQRTCSVLILFKAYQSEAWRILEDLGGSWRLIEDWLKIDWRLIEGLKT